jgi:hypothetical protein
MTPQADQKDTTRRSRRQLLAGGTSALAAVLAAEAIARPAPAYAGTDGDVVLGVLNNASSQTTVKCTTAGDLALEDVAAGSGMGPADFSGRGPGPWARSDSAEGLYALAAVSLSDTASQAQSFGGNGVVGVDMSTGVYGQSGATNGFALTRDGVRGFTDSSAASGVRGQNANGVNGVSGVTPSSGSLGPRRSMAPTPAAGRE